jgi:alkylation response protein AidB-like acyl-CoA dehydrogenase
MDFGLSEDQLLLKDTIKRFLAERCPTTRVRQIMEGDAELEKALWKELAELGAAGVIVPAEHGGLEREMLDLALVAEELGYAATPGPFIGAAMATVALVEGGDPSLQQQWLPAMASGDAIVTVAWGEADAEWTPERLHDGEGQPLERHQADGAGGVAGQTRSSLRRGMSPDPVYGWSSATRAASTSPP